MSAAAALPQLCLDYRKCKIAFVYSLSVLSESSREGGWQREAAEREGGRERQQRAGYERVCAGPGCAVKLL